MGQIRDERTRMESSVFRLQSLESNPESGPDPIVIHSFENVGRSSYSNLVKDQQMHDGN